jgi:hypothetical protein
MKLYELAQNYNNLLDLLENPDIPQDVINKSLEEVEEDFNVKAENICKLIKSVELEAKAIKEEERRLADRRKSLEHRVVNLKAYLNGTMTAIGAKKIKGNIFTLSIQKNPHKVVIKDEELIPGDYVIVEKIIDIDKKGLLAALKAGEKIEGAELIQTESLRIK